ncbi:cuticle protein 21-like [Macrobrachium rosenbergii]|uniref:cuticle protein 21-like n=1 Tax=Macrobrachium rosenbergii TaxID=79674 RepID=UPI0034D53E6E
MKVFVIASFLAAVWAFPHPQLAPAPEVGQSAVWPIRPYSYAYEISDPPTGNFQNKAEIKNANGDVFGSWSVLMPDNYIYTTSYNVTGLSGFLYNIVKTLANPAAVTAPAAA